MTVARGPSSSNATRVAGLAAGACFALALAASGSSLDGYVQTEHPIALLGAVGMPRAGAFNVFAYLAPGLLAAFVALRRRGGLASRAGLSARLGWNLALVAALLFAAQGVLPLDPANLDEGAGRLHGAAWGGWGIAVAAASAALALAAVRSRRPLPALAHVVAGTLVFALAWLSGDAMPVAIAQRAACACWFAWLAMVAWAPAGPDARAPG